jgi:transposase
MIAFPASVRVWLAVGRTDMRHGMNGLALDHRGYVRQQFSAPLVAGLQTWMGYERRKLSGGNDVAKAMDYMLKRWTVFARFVDDGRIFLTNNTAESGLRGIALGRKSWLFAGSDRGGQRAAVIYSLLVSAKMNDTDPQAWLAYVLANIARHPIRKLDQRLPWNWRLQETATRKAA